MAGNENSGRKPREKSFANMLKIAINEANEQGGTKLRDVANALVTKAISGDVQAIKEIADRLDGKVPQGLIGGEEGDNPLTVLFQWIGQNTKTLVEQKPDE